MKAWVAIIGGSGVKSIVKGQSRVLGTPYGPTPPLTLGEVSGKSAVFLLRHGEHHENPPHKVNYRANIWGLKTLGVERIIATNAVGGIDEQLNPGDMVSPVDIVDFTKSRPGTFYDGPPVTHIDVSQPYCPKIREALAAASKENGRPVRANIVMASTQGPRYETPAEIRMLKMLGCGIVSMTGAPEVFLARELEMCYASISFVTNMAAGMQRTLSATEVEERGRETSLVLTKIIATAIARIPKSRQDCPCSTALTNAQLRNDMVKEAVS
ncbi:MAG TPA: S-methyl-5'-thioinosine phosphorylase [Candidatus Bathyarchaeia archaeon]|nr:S-methyl-5'-thioinosine phosphorylase [Candidatus Bathyarchaeia archaeon]